MGQRLFRYLGGFKVAVVVDVLDHSYYSSALLRVQLFFVLVIYRQPVDP